MEECKRKKANSVFFDKIHTHTQTHGVFTNTFIKNAEVLRNQVKNEIKKKHKIEIILIKYKNFCWKLKEKTKKTEKVPHYEKTKTIKTYNNKNSKNFQNKS